MDFTEENKGIYKPIGVLFGTPIYEETLKVCWHISSYKLQIVLLAELLRLQQNKQLSCEVTAEDMTEENKQALRMQLWEFQLQDLHEADARHLLKLVWEVNTSLKTRNVEFEARRLLNSPETLPAQFKHPTIIIEADKYARRLTNQKQEAAGFKLLSLREVMMEVVPKVLQNFWLPPQCSSYSMPSQQLRKMAVGLTKVVEDQVSDVLSSMLQENIFLGPIRDDMVMSVQERVRRAYTEDIPLEKLSWFASDLLSTVSGAATGEICELFQLWSHTETDSTESPASSPPTTHSDEVPVITAAKEHLTNNQTEPPLLSSTLLELDSLSAPAAPITPDSPPCDAFSEPVDQSTSFFEPLSAMISPPSFSVFSFTNEPPPHCHNKPVQQPQPNEDAIVVPVQPPCHTSTDEPPVIQDEVKTDAEGEVQRLLNCFFYCFVLPSDKD